MLWHTSRFDVHTAEALYRDFDGEDVPPEGLAIETSTKSILVKDAVVILVAIGGLLAFYSVLALVSGLARIPLP